MRIKDVYLLTPLQEGIFFHWKVSNEMYFEQASYKIKGKLEIEYLKRSYDILIARHDALRTCFLDNVEEEILQIVQKEVPSNFEYIDLSTNVKLDANKIKEEDIQKGFDLTKGSQMRLKVLKLDENSYEFVWSHHHIIMDGWCIGILIKEFFVIYESLLEERESSLPKLTPFAEYIKWLSKKDKNKSLEYWKNYLDGTKELVSLPFPKKSKESYKPKEIFYTIKGTIKEKLTHLCKELGITENVFFQTIWGILLAKHNNTNDVVFGGVVSGRPAEIQGVENMIGLFINTIPVRINFDKTQAVEQVLLESQEKAIKSLPFHFNHINEIQQVANKNKSLFDHIIVFENYPVDELITNEFRSEKKQSDIELVSTEFYEGANYDFSLTILPGEEIKVRFTFDSDVYNESDIETLKNHFDCVLNQVIRSPKTQLLDIEYMSESEKKELLFISQSKEEKFIEKDCTIIKLFENVASKKENNIALLFENKEYSYKELNALSNQLADYLVNKCKIEAEDFIGVELGRNDWLIIAILGVFKSSGVYVPLDINLPKERRDYIVSDTGCKVIIDENFIKEFINYKEISALNTEFKILISPSNLAYVIYTSGSTGKPKGVLVEHKNIASLFKNIEGDFYDELTMPLLASNSFDIFLFELFYPLLSGGKVCVLTNENIKNITFLVQTLTKVNSFHAVPTLMRTIIDYIKDKRLEKEFYHIKTIYIGGDKIPSGILEEMNQVFPKAVINVLYGPTEGTIFITTESYNHDVKQYNNRVIGRGNSNNNIYVLDSDLKLCPFYSIGELCISGNQVTRGYLNKPIDTDLKYVENPFALNERMYRTGDMVKRLPNGKIEFVGRKDNQVKVRGYRIELEEIENIILTHKLVQSVIVKVITVDTDEKEIVAYFTAPKKLKASLITDFIKEYLPVYMVPNYFVQLKEIPLTINGKIDVNKLPSPLKSNNISEVEYQSVTNEVEAKLLEIWKKILHNNHIGINDNFFHVGGHSLKMMKLVNRIFSTFGVHIEIKKIYTENTIKKQAVYIKNCSKTDIKSIPKAKSSQDYPLSSSQYRIWNISVTNKEANKANNIRLLKVKDESVNIDALTRAFNELIERHEVLRTAFIINEEGNVRQQIIAYNEVEKLEVEFIDLRESKHKDQDLEEAAHKLIDIAFDLEKPPLVKAGLICIENNKWVISTVIHHIVFDGESTEIFAKELEEFYAKYDKNKEVTLPPLPIQFKDYAVWEQNKINGGLELGKKFWLGQFEGNLPILSDFGDNIRPKIKTYNGEEISRSINGEILKQLDNLCSSLEVSPFVILLSISNILLHKYTTDEDIIVGTPIANRIYPETFNQIGFFANTIALRTQLTEENSFLEILNSVKKTVNQAKIHQDFPFNELVNLLEVPYDPSRNSLFDVMVTYDESEEVSMTNHNIFEPLADGNTNVKFDLTFAFKLSKSDLILSLQYNKDIYSFEKITALVSHFEQLFIQLLTHKEEKIKDIEYLTIQEKDYLIEELGEKKTNYPEKLSIIEIFHKQVAMSPNKIALVYEDKRYTYKELNKLSNSLAIYLQANYKVKNDFIAIVLPKSEWQIVAILAVLKTGSAYVPIAMDFPEDRIEYIIKDTKAKCKIDENLIEEFLKVREDYSNQLELAYVDSTSLAYAMYTSGSTGMPKGVLVEHKSVIRLVKNTNYVDLIGDEVLLATGAFSFDATTFEYWGMLLNGGTLVLCSEDVLLSPQDMTTLINEENVNIMWFTSGWLNQLVDYDISLFKNLKTVLCGGDVLSKNHITKLKSTYPKLEIINGYGPTENTTFSLAHKVKLPIKRSVPLGKPISNSSVYILDKNNSLVPKGVVGEICLGGDGLARGYINNKELTNEKFIVNPFKEGGKLYKTGDLGRWLMDDTIEFIGRKDNQVKVRGYRIELEEIENILCTHELVSSSLVLVNEALAGEKLIVAYIVGENNLEVNELRSWIRTKLPNYMVPNNFVLLNEFPLTVNGKIDKKKLPKITSFQSERPSYIAPETNTEKIIVKIWEDVLGISEIGLNDNFFDLGGHSLKAVKMFNLISSQLKTKLTLPILFNNPTIKDLSKEIDNIIWVNSSESTEIIETDSITI